MSERRVSPGAGGRAAFRHAGEPAPTRRGFLGAAGTAVLGGLAGCLGGQTDVSVLAAGSLASVFESAVGPAFASATEYGYRGEFNGSNAVMRMVLDERKRPDVIVSADAELLRTRLPEDLAPWDVVFASNALVLAYDPDTETGRRLADGEPWYEVLSTTEEPVARSDPDLDPLGYRALLLFELAAEHYGVEGLRSALAERLVVDPKESHLLAGVETGNRAGALVYENMAVDHDLPYVELPPALNFSDPAYADRYATASYTTNDGTTVTGRPIRYAVTVPTTATHPEAGRRFAAFLCSHPDRLRENGLVVPDAVPQERGPVPAEVVAA